MSTYPYIPARNPNCIIEEICCQPDFRAIGTEGKCGAIVPLQILTDQLTPFQPRGADYAHHITSCPFGFLDLPTTLDFNHSCWTIRNRARGSGVSGGNHLFRYCMNRKRQFYYYSTLLSLQIFGHYVGSEEEEMPQNFDHLLSHFLLIARPISFKISHKGVREESWIRWLLGKVVQVMKYDVALSHFGKCIT